MMNGQTSHNPFDSANAKLGLALSGGGFRASLFHIGVLARLAELDLLGKIEVISSVSGGSIVAAMYYLMLKQLLESSAAPKSDDFIALVQRLEVQFLNAVQTNPRTRIVIDPIQNVRMLLSDYSRTDRMAGLYNRAFYRPIWKQIFGEAPTAISLPGIKITPPGYPTRDAYNAAHAYKIPMLVINATTLNTGKNFRFTASEVGDPELGYIRFDSAADLVALRGWLKDPVARTPPVRLTPELQQLALALHFGPAAAAGALVQLLSPAGVAALQHIGLTALYRMRHLAWIVTHQGGADAQAAYERLEKSLGKLEIGLGQLHEGLREAGITVYELFDGIYLTRVSDKVADTCDDDVNGLSLERAVAASAAVPGVFEPIILRDIYDDAVVESVRLMDGGIYDNQGFTALFEENCTHMICSDASGQLRFERDAAGKITGVLSRTNDVLMEKIRFDGLEALAVTHDTTEALGALVDGGCISTGSGAGKHLDELYDLHHVKQTAFFHLRSTFQAPGLPAPPGELQEAISKVRTDLDSFSNVEAYTLMYDGYYLASHTLIPRWFSDFVPPATEPHPPPPDRWRFYPIAVADPELLRHIEVAANRFYKVFRLRNRWSALAWLGAAAIFVVAWVGLPLMTLNEVLVWPLWLFGYRDPITVGFFVPFQDRLIAWFPRLKDIVDFSILPLGDLFDLRIHVPFALLVVVAVYAAYQVWGGIKKRLIKGESRRVWRVIRFVIRWKRSPLFPIAVAWAFVAAIAAWLHLLVFDKLFLKGGRA